MFCPRRATSFSSIASFARSWLPAISFVFAASACQGGAGEGFVRGEFTVDECTRGEIRRFDDFGYTPARFATSRFMEVLTIGLQDEAVDTIESDIFAIRIPDVRPLRIRDTPFSLPISLDPQGANAALSLYRTCPVRPQLQAVTGTVTFEVFEIAEDPDDTGSQEVLRGTVTASVTGPSSPAVVGSIEASFDFFPESRNPQEIF